MGKKRFTYLFSEMKSMDAVIRDVERQGYRIQRLWSRPVFREDAKQDEVQYTPVDKEIIIEAKK